MQDIETIKHTLSTGEEVIFRSPQVSDTQAMLDYINTLSAEQTFILMQGEQLRFEEEEQFVKDSLVAISYGRKVLLLAFVGSTLVGVAGIELKTRAEKHVGVFGISIAKEYRGKGIGKLLMGITLDEAKKKLPDIKIVTLGVFSNNPLAKSMYEKFGFKEYGRLPKGAKHRDDYVDHIEMYKEI